MWAVELMRRGAEYVILQNNQAVDPRTLKIWENRKKQCETISIASGLSFVGGVALALKQTRSPLSRQAAVIAACASAVIFVLSRVLEDRSNKVCRELKKTEGANFGTIPSHDDTKGKEFPEESWVLRNRVNGWHGYDTIDLEGIDQSVVGKANDYFTLEEKAKYLHTFVNNYSEGAQPLFFTTEKITSNLEILQSSHRLDWHQMRESFQTMVEPFFVDVVCNNGNEKNWIHFVINVLPRHKNNADIDENRDHFWYSMAQRLLDSSNSIKITGDEALELYRKRCITVSVKSLVTQALGEFYWTLPKDKTASVIGDIIKKLQVEPQVNNQDRKELHAELKSITFESVQNEAFDFARRDVVRMGLSVYSRCRNEIPLNNEIFTFGQEEQRDLIMRSIENCSIDNENSLLECEKEVLLFVPELDQKLFTSTLTQVLNQVRDKKEIDFSGPHGELLKITTKLGLGHLKEDDIKTEQASYIQSLAEKIVKKELQENFIVAVQKETIVEALFRFFYHYKFPILTNEQKNAIKAQVNALEETNSYKELLLMVAEQLLNDRR